MTSMTVLCLCRAQDLTRERSGYAKAFRNLGDELVCIPDDFPINGDIRELMVACSVKPALILQPEGATPCLPWGLSEVGIPTVCFQIDTYAYTQRRVRWSMLFDYAIVFHPGFDERFREAGHPNALMFPHAIDTEMFRGPATDRVYDIGWVGRLEGPLYETRRRIVPALARQFRMNEWWRPHNTAEMVEVYKASKLVVNIGAELHHYSHGMFEANLRCFEAMAAGALLITQRPIELRLLGFREGVHFVTYADERELLDSARYYLAHEGERLLIANAGREKVLREHTYDRRVETLLQLATEAKGPLPAPARRWPHEQVRLVYLDYYAAHDQLGYAWKELRNIARRRSRLALAGVWLIAWAWARRWRALAAGAQVQMR